MPLTSTPEGLAALREMVTEVMAALQPPPKLSVAQWADRERRLSSEASAEPGRWYTDRAPYLRGIMDAISDPTVREVGRSGEMETHRSRHRLPKHGL